MTDGEPTPHHTSNSDVHARIASTEADPVLVRRAQVAHYSALGKRLGYMCILVACIAFGCGLFLNFGTAVTAIVVGALALSAVFLVPATIFGYGVKAADREDRGEKFTY